MKGGWRASTSGAANGVALGLALIAVPPTLLAAAGDTPLHRILRAPRLSWSFALNVAVLGSWIAWAGCVLPIARRVVNRLRAAEPGMPHTERGWDRAASPIAAALFVLGSTIGPIGARGVLAGRPRFDGPSGVVALVSSSEAANRRTRRVEVTRLRHESEPGSQPSVVGTDLTRIARADGAARARALEAGTTAIAPAPGTVDVPATVSDLATVALCCMGVAAIGRRVQLRRRQQRRPTGLSPDTSELQLMHAATSRLEVLLRDIDSRVPPVQLIRVGSDDLELFLQSKIDWAPVGMRLSSNGNSWISSHQACHAATSSAPEPARRWLVIPIGSDASNFWGVLLEIGASVAVLGPSAHELIASFVAPMYQPPLTEWIRVHSSEHGVDFEWAGSPATGARAQVTTQPSLRADLTIVVDERAITIHPFGVTLLPLAASSQRADVAAPTQDVHPVIVSEAIPAREHTAGLLEVRLLTTVPRIDGLTNPLPAKRARRVIELLAYLAIHNPDPVSGDRLRTRVLGTPDADAAAKTLFNTVGAARQALGIDPDGNPYLPSASRQGHYRLSDLVGIDVLRALRTFEQARESDRPDVSLALYRSGLDLVEGEPLAGVLSGYSWWRSEGHEARLTAAVVDAACNAVRLAILCGFFDMTTWILDRARLVDPYTEILSRAAMRAAAAAGDQAGLRREWSECVRRICELDPEASPSLESFRLFNALVSRSDGSAPQASFDAIDEAP